MARDGDRVACLTGLGLRRRVHQMGMLWLPV